MSEQPITPEITSEDKLWALLSYLINPIVPIIALLMEDKKKRPFIRYHAVHALAFLVAASLSYVLVITVCLSPLYLIYAIYLMVKAYQGEYVTIPVITDLIKKQGWA